MITGKTRLIGIFGKPIEHSMSPLIHNAAFKELGLDFAYIPFLVEEEALKAAVEGLRALNLVGVNVTIPHKEKVIPFLDQLSEEAKLIGAVNVIVNKDGLLTGHNTDGQGFVTSLREEAGVDPQGKKVVLLGAGGAARAVAIQLALEGAKEIYILNRRAEKGESIATAINNNTETRGYALALNNENLRHALRDADILINSTPIGMYPKDKEPSIVDKALLEPNLLVCDLIYNPLETTLLREAKEKGCQTLKGTGMLIYQGALAFEKWTGKKAPVELMNEVLLKKLK